MLRVPRGGWFALAIAFSFFAMMTTWKTGRTLLLRRLAASTLPIEFFLADLAQRFGRSDLSLSESARAWMSDYSWPGNLRELRNVLEREVVLAGAGEDSPAMLDPSPPVGAPRAPRSLAEMEREHIQRALAFARGHQGRAAAILGISRKSLWEKRKRYGLP